MLRVDRFNDQGTRLGGNTVYLQQLRHLLQVRIQGLPAVQCTHDDRQDRELQRDPKNPLQPPRAPPPFPANDHVVRIPRAAREPPELGHVPWERHEIFARRAVAAVVRLAVVPHRPSELFLHPRIVLCARFFADRE